MNQTDKDEWAQVQALFESLVDLAPAARETGLAKANAPEKITHKVRELLASTDMVGILDGRAPELGGLESRAPAASLTAGQTIGLFTIERLLGRGGMGEVYLAHRTSADFDQAVALKLLRIEAAEQGHLFARERRMLARLDHPGIARLIDGGIAPDGRPYMAMDYVDGQPIDAWCRDHAADLGTRLAKVRAICDAVSYAHANLVIHRDLKPSNILVDRNGNIRLLDFGIAKLLDEAAALPATTQALMTPDYAAPEQLEGDDATVVTDVYSLGVILYELVAGVGPWRREGNSVPAIIRRVLYEDPALPSAAAKRDGAPIAAAKITGDLDAIILKAMRRDPASRYRSVADLSDDLGRHLDIKPVKAREGSTRYMAGRFVRRYRWAVGASVTALLALLVGAGGIAWQARQTAIERDLAMAEARRSESINRMLTLMFRDTAASDKGENATVRQMLDQTATQLVASVDTSVKSATLVTTLSDLYVNMEDMAAADGLLRRAVEKGIGKGDPVATAQINLRLASTAAALGRNDEIAGLLDSAEPIFRSDPARFPGELVEVTSARAQLARRSGDTMGAIRMLTGILPEVDKVYAENHRDQLTIYNNLLVYMIEANQLDAMPAIFARADAVVKRTGQEQSGAGLSLAQLKGLRLLKLNQPEQAERIFTDLVARRRTTFGRSAGLAVELTQLSRAKIALGKYAEAKAALLEARPIALENLGPTAIPTLVIGISLAEAMAETGDLAGANKVLNEVSPLVDPMPKTAAPVGLLARARAVLLFKQGKRDQAMAELDRAQAVFKGLGPAGATFLSSLPKLRSRIAEGG